MKIQVLGISASPRRHGNSAYLLEQALAAAREALPAAVETESYTTAGKKFAGCIECFKCVEQGGECGIKDSFQELRDKWNAADVVLYSVPVFHMCIPGQLRCFIDRLGNCSFSYYGMAVPKPLKVIGAITQGLHAFSGQENVMMQIINHAMLMGCIPVSGDAPECYIGAGGWTSNDLDRDALKTQVAESLSDAEMLLRGTRSLAKRAVELALMVKTGAGSNRDVLGADPMYRPLYERLAQTE